MANDYSIYAICNAMAAKIATVTPPTGETLRKAWGQAPNNVAALPAVIIEPQSGTLKFSGGTYDGETLIDAILLLGLASGDSGRIETRRQKWLPVLLYSLNGQMQLGLGSWVRKVYPVEWEFITYEYGKVEYVAIRVRFRVDTFDMVTWVL